MWRTPICSSTLSRTSATVFDICCPTWFSPIREILSCAADGPAIIDVVVVPDEHPNLPHLDLDMIGHVAIAKVKEAVLAVTGA
jgi:hypothetical protein